VTGNRSTIAARVRHLVPSPLRRAAARVVADLRAADVERRLAALARDPRPIVVGPWLGEVGFELLYWVPFVRWFAERYEVAPERLIVVTRGGAASWYGSLAAQAFDALAAMPADEFRARNDQRAGSLGEQKQLKMTALEEDLVALVRRERGRDVVVLHPSLMFHLFAPYWWGHRPIEWVERYTRHVRLPPPAIDIELPPDYTAVKFYFNDCFRSSAANREFVERTIRALANEGPVISLSTGVAVDGHAPCEPDIAAMRGIQHLLTPDTNLLVQSAVVARARRFVGSYGGFAYLAPFYGVPTVSYFTEPGTYSLKHLDLATHVLARGGAPQLLQVTQAPA
jgi:hypothetical protein